ncbi:MAG: peptidyl-prolyl cis-trans isomerase [Candidatus Omnitrophota bacterium]
MMRPVWCAALIAFFLSCAGMTPAIAGTLDKIIVVVNGETITKGELDQAVASIVDRIHKESTDATFAEKLAAARKEILDRMVEERLILSAAKKKEMKIQTNEVEARLQEVKDKFGSEEKFNEALREDDISVKDLRQRYEDQLKVGKYVETEVRKKIVIAPSELLEYYTAHQEEFRQPEQAHLSNILIKPAEDRTDDEARLLAEKILGFIKAGESFGELALKYSKGPNADRGGDMGFVNRGTLMKQIDDAAFALSSGQVTDVIKTTLGYHIFKVQERRPEGVQPFDEVKGAIEKMLFFNKGKELYAKMIDDLKKNAYISYR